MKAVVYRGIGDISLTDVPDPKIQEPTDAIIRITASAICGTDLHMIRGSMGPMKQGIILGHEAIGVVEQVGKEVRNLKEGDRVVIPSTISCGYCSYCRAGYFSQCDNANPNGARAGTAFFGGPLNSGSFNGLQAEKARIPYANVGPVKIPDSVTNDQALILSDIFPTGYFGAELAEITPGDTVAVFGCGPVGLFAIASAKLLSAGRILAVDSVPSRLELAKSLGAEIINFEQEDPVDIILQLTGGIGVDRVIDAVGVDAARAHSGPAKEKSDMMAQQFKEQLKQVAPEANFNAKSWKPGDAPSQALIWELGAIDKAGTLAIIGVYPDSVQFFPLGIAMNKNLTLKMGNCNHRRYIPQLLKMVASGMIDPLKILSQLKIRPLSSVYEAYKDFDAHSEGWIKVEIVPGL